ncbi:Glyoxalase/bleomycin resistance protein/dioxygenase [Halalkalicoccus jeotgali B3] [Mycobacterium shimoidei]|uniref:Glyoxalase/bleomycin resistance protein/dioxygenase [Halalkalicoccus jeotgali B3] n=1 Tax=Mycobacterium shimoidei TaxID=29313 RepID=A0A375Z054_MYCSH|nr:VOC family protein [Mycobacterium shimoidei]SRX94375.1 Glyoxalase/bleomycin resistance protein/dioxygenase [Halalkalicoccus jeotgali B3] [Mycobacterium shimoidei]
MTGVDHVGLCVADLEVSLRFYRDGVGLDVLADFTLDADLEPLLGVATSHVRTVFLGAANDGGKLELIDLGEPRPEPPGPGVPHRGLFLVSFVTPVQPALDRLDALGMGGKPRIMAGLDGSACATVVDPDGVTVELLERPVAQLSSSRNQ